MTALGAIILRENSINLDRLTERLVDMGSAEVLVRRAHSIAAVSETKSLNEMANLVIRSYNKSLRIHRIEDFATRADLFARGRPAKKKPVAEITAQP